MPLRNQFSSEAEWLEHLRLYFAAKAMSGALGGAPGGHLRHDNLARESYAIADAMLRAREVKS